VKKVNVKELHYIESRRKNLNSGFAENDTNFGTVKPVLNRPFIKRNFVLNGNVFRPRDYRSIH
jgi:hypothetical protein